ncbi:NUDIX hydrolase [Micrococcus flavus]|uniref:8-oxo-dGTP pyrophosphatase MutT (NUDIX family) n=1 Tax=Micrococcus flavus TaxID=384602 RepID=A0A4Y8WXW2_9MICC|nr:NUDIX hydrolase [Micrococcus flavus]MBB4883799.1 8-oxo-dGTP pyrophosphatase MutT (NUDIX family) [Micrococcus flavus]TFI00314.1 NUDIX hydrolase [Micrococcus flavus]
MSSPDPSAHRGAPLPSALGARRRPPQQPPRPAAPAPAGPRTSSASGLPTVEEVSAGGIVIREHHGDLQVAVIARYNRGGRLEWCLPKGHPEGEEDHRQAAVREVEEETGIAGDILEPLGSIDYWFTVSRHRVHKTVHHFLLRATGGELTTENDPDHEAVDVAWVGIDDVARRLSFANERRIVDLARRILPQHFPGDHSPGRL